MSLELNEQHIDILKEVRERLQAQLEGSVPLLKESKYICTNIVQAVARRAGCNTEEMWYESYDLPEEVIALSSEMTNAIDIALRRESTLGMLIADLGLNITASDIMDNIAPLARLAWLDRMIETKVIE